MILYQKVIEAMYKFILQIFDNWLLMTERNYQFLKK